MKKYKDLEDLEDLNMENILSQDRNFSGLSLKKNRNINPKIYTSWLTGCGAMIRILPPEYEGVVLASPAVLPSGQLPLQASDTGPQHHCQTPGQHTTGISL